MTDRFYFIILILSVVFIQIDTLECDPSHMNFVSQYSLGKQDEFNRSFTKIQTKIPTINTVNYTAPNGYQYSIYDIKAIFYYRDSKQKATARG